MKGWPNRRRLLWGRRSLIKGLALPVALLFIAILALGFYFIPLGTQNHNQEINTVDIKDAPEQDASNDLNMTDSNKSRRDLLKIASLKQPPSTITNASDSPGSTPVQPDNMSKGSFGTPIIAAGAYGGGSAGGYGSSGQDRLETKAALAMIEPRFNLTIETNRSEGNRGDAVSYSCVAVNTGLEAISNIVLNCADEKISTTYLSPGKEIHLNGSLLINESEFLNATVNGTSVDGRNWKANASTRIWMVSPNLGLKAVAGTDHVHKGDNLSIALELINQGNSSLSDIGISDTLGHIGQISILDPGKSVKINRSLTAIEEILDQVTAVAHDPSGKEVYGSTKVKIEVLSLGLNLTAIPKEAAVYPGQPLDATWILSNTGEEVLKNVTLNGAGSKYRLKEIAPGSSIRVSTIYVPNKTSTINVTARGYSSKGYPVYDSRSILVKAVSPGISLKVTPADVVAFAGEDVSVTCLVTNTGNDDLNGVTLYKDGALLESIDMLAPGDFQVFSPSFKVASNSTIDFKVTGLDSLGRTWSDSSRAEAKLILSAIKISASAPDSVKFGESAKITILLDNPGSVPIYNILVNSKTFGPLGLVEFLAPRQQRTLQVDQPLDKDARDEIEAEGTTSAKEPVVDRCVLKISVIRPKAPASVGESEQNRPRADATEETSQMAQIGTTSSSFGNTHENLSSSRMGSISLAVMTAKSGQNEISAAGSTSKRSEENASVVTNRSAAIRSGNVIAEEIAGIVHYIKKMLEKIGIKTQAASRPEPLPSAESRSQDSAYRSYELAIESAKGSDHGRIKVLDVGAAPPHPSAGTPVKITVHVQSETGIESASTKYGVRDAPVTKMQMSSVERVFAVPMMLESGDKFDGYWSATIPGWAAGTYMVLSVALKDDYGEVDDGPYMLHWSTLPSAAQSATTTQKASGQGMLYIESSVVRGTGEVSIKDTFDDSSISFSDRLKGNGSINLESLRSMDKSSPMVNFTQKSDLVFEGGQLKGEKSLASPAFHGGLGASITESFNLSHVQKSETDIIRSQNSSDNTLAFSAEQAFNGTWNIKTQYAQFFKKIKGNQQYTGSFQTQKNITFQDLGKK